MFQSCYSCSGSYSIFVGSQGGVKRVAEQGPIPLQSSFRGLNAWKLVSLSTVES